MKLARICVALLATLTFATIAAAQCGPAKPKGTSGAGTLDDMIIAQEKAIIEAIKKGDAAAFKSMVDQNGTAIDSNGIKKISDVTPMLFDASLKFSEYTLEDPKVMMVDKNTAMINYKSSATATMNGKSQTGSSYETTIFVRRAGKWIGVFHQSTEIQKPAAGMTGGTQ